MPITEGKFKDNMGTDFATAASEEIPAAKCGKATAEPTAPYLGRLEAAKSLFGIIPPIMTLEESRDERLSSK